MSHHALKTASIGHSVGHSVRSLLRRPSAAITLFVPGLALAGPTGEDVIRGDANVVRPDANTTVINQLTNRAAINWQTFNVDADEFVTFFQPGASSIVLNRVLGGDASRILGQIQANGQVFLLNPHGVFFTEGATLDVQGFLGSTLDMNPDDFMAGNFSLTRSAASPSTARVVNAGNLTAGPGGYVVLAGDFTENTGIITAHAGTVALVAGSALTLDIEGDGLVNFGVDAATLGEAAGVRNAGQILADGGTVVMTAKVANDLVATAVNNEGLIRARSIEERDGEIYLVGYGGDVANSGTLDADGENANGGRIGIYSDRDVTLADDGVQTAAGDAGHAGGMIRAIAEDHLDYQHTNLIRVTGGTSGGFVEVSGHGSINLRGIPQIGAGGALFIDPPTINIINGSGSGNTPAGSGGTIEDAYIERQLNLNVNVILAASNGGSVTAQTGTSITATGSGDLTIGIGALGGTNTTCVGLNSSFCFGPAVTFLQGGFGNIGIGNLNVNIAGDIIIDAGDSGTVTTGNLATTAGSVRIHGGGIALNGNVTAGGNVQLNADAVGSTPVPNVSVLGAINAMGAVDIAALATSFGGGDIIINQGITGASVTMSAEGGRVTVGNGEAGSNFTGGDIQATAGNVTINLTGNVGGGDGVIFTGDIIATGGDVTLTASTGQGAIGIGDYVSGSLTPGNITAGGQVDVSASGSNARIDAGNIQAGLDVNLNAFGAGGGGSIKVGDVFSEGNVFISGIHGASHIVGDVDARFVNANFTPLLNGSVNVTMGALSVHGTSLGSRDVVVGINHAGGNSSTGNLTLNGATADNGNVLLQVLNGASSLAAVNGNLTVGGAIDAASFVALWAPNDVVTQSLTASNAGAQAAASVHAGMNGSGGISVNGAITVSGAASSGNPLGATVFLRTGNGGDISVSGPITVSAAAAAYSFLSQSGAASTGNQGIATLVVGAGLGTITLGDIDVSAVGNGHIDVQGLHIAVGDVSLNVADGSFTRTQNFSPFCNDLPCNFTRTETMTAGGNGDIRFAYYGIATDATLAFGDVSIVAPDGHFDAHEFVSIDGGAITVTATGVDFAIASSGTFNGSAIDYQETVLGGGATVNLETRIGGAVILGGAVTLEGAGRAALHVSGDTIKLLGVDVNASGGTFTRSGAPVPEFLFSSPDRDGPFENDGDGDGPRIDQGTITGGMAEVTLTGIFNSELGETTASLVEIDGAVNIAAVGDARLSVNGSEVTVTGAIGITAGHAQQNGTFDSVFFDSSLGSSVQESGTLTGSYGTAEIEIAPRDGATGAVTLGAITLSGPGANGHIEGSTISVGAVTLTASVGALDVDETRIIGEGTDTENFRFDGPGFLAGFGIAADGAVNVSGDVNITGVGAAGMLVSGTSIATRNITITVTDGGYSVLAPDIFGSTETAFTVGNALLGFEGATANVTGAITMTADGQAHFGGAADLSGDFTVTTGRGITAIIPNTVQFINDVDDSDALALPAGFNITAANIALAGGDIGIAGAVLDAGNIGIGADGDANLANTVIDATVLNIGAGGDVTVSGAAITAGTLVIQADAIRNGGAPATITAGGAALIADTVIALGETTLNVGTTAAPGAPIDLVLLQLLAVEGLAPSSGMPSLYVSAPQMTLGNLDFDGDYMVMHSNRLTFAGSVATTQSDLLVQLVPFASAATMTLENSAPGTGDANYTNAGHLGLFAGATVALGTTAHTGSATIGTAGPIDIGSTNLFVLTEGTVTGLDRVLSTGVVKDLATLLGRGGFEVPQTDEIDTRQDVVQTLRDEYEVEDRGSEDEEEGDEEGEDTDTDTDVEEDDDSLISRDTAEEEMMCR